MTGQRIQQEAICYQWFKQRLILSFSEVLNPVLANGHRFRRTPSKPLCLPENLISNHTPLQPDTMIRPVRASNPDLPITVARLRVPRRYQQRHRGRGTLRISHATENLQKDRHVTPKSLFCFKIHHTNRKQECMDMDVHCICERRLFYIS